MNGEKRLTIPEAARLLEVSQATIRNWLRSGLLDSLLTSAAVQQFRASLIRGETGRLRQRANKQASSRLTQPAGSAGNPGLTRVISQLADLRRQGNLTTDSLLFLVTLGWLERSGEVALALEGSHKPPFQARRKWVQTLLEERQNTLHANSSALGPVRDLLQSSGIKPGTDLPGLLYQSLVSEGDRWKSGSYYTPEPVVKKMTGKLVNPDGRFLDPCCGTGTFLVQAARLNRLTPDGLFGLDTDETALFIARINLYLEYPGYDGPLNLFLCDALENQGFSEGFFDAVATNPPWGLIKNGPLSLSSG
ncbi:MAG: N-6 DNA methylase, partial [Bacteroidales bacterium]